MVLDSLPTPASPRIACFGVLVHDTVTVLETPLCRGGNAGARISESPGGGAANTAWMARLAGADVRFIGHAGTDGIGDRQVHELAAAGIETCLVRKGRTTRIVVLVDPDAERSFAVDAASSMLYPDDVTAQDFTNCGIVHLQAEKSPQRGALALTVARYALAQGALLSIDLASAAAAAAPATQRLLAMGPAAVFANDEEFVAAWPQGSPSEEGLIVHKRGPEPVRLWHRGCRVEVPSIPVAHVVDTTGAGDCFAGTFLAAWSRGLDPVQAAVLGHQSAALVIARPGARLGTEELPTGLPLGPRKPARPAQGPHMAA